MSIAMKTMISIVLPVYNRFSGLGNGIRELKAVLDERICVYEIIIVDDGSVNKDQIKAIADLHSCNYLRNDRNAGKGMAVKKGILASTGELIIFMDGDFPFHLDVINRMIDALQHHLIVIGDRTLPGSRYAKETVIMRKAGSRILSLLISRFYVKGITDSQCGIKGFREKTGKAIFNKLTQSGFSFDVELLFVARKNRIDIKRLPVHVVEQEGSSVNVFKDGFVMLFSLFSILFNQAQGKYRINE
ncbi:MAG: glycosyltransferase [Chitinophagaceae bacterium]|nr:glycosyltransferase [Chitinophagaceae bacterium]